MRKLLLTLAIIGSLTSCTKDNSGEIDRLEKELVAANTALTKAQNELAITTTLLAEAQSNLATLQTQTETQSATISALAGDVDYLLGLVATLEQEILDLQAQADVDAATIADLQAQVDALNDAAAQTQSELIQSIIDGVMFLYAPSLDTDGDGQSNILTSEGEDTGFDLNDLDLDNEEHIAILLDSFAGYVAKF